VAQLLQDWYRGRARAYLPPLVHRYARQIGAERPTLKVVAMKTRWGSCSPGAIRVHWQVMMAPRHLVRYVVAHEVCHLRHPDHSRAFWRLLHRVMPDCRRLHAELAVLGPRLAL
jgi:predicted metal-dependent hydrolase